MQLSAAGISIGSIPAECLSFDVAFDGHRVWTVEIDELTSETPDPVEWPNALVEHLVGHTTVSVTDSATGEEFFHGEVRFSEATHRTLVVNKQGTHLAINKWGDLAPALEGLAPEILARLLNSTAGLISRLHELNFRPFVVGGTLLGAVREGRLLPHDDDADIAYLSRYTNPVDIAVESFSLGHKLRALGYEIVRHSAAHMQLVFRNSSGTVEYHIDIFSAFFTEDGNINQPFHVRGPFRQDQMLPFGVVSIDGHDFPAPAEPEAWLVINYDENWRTPIPGYRLATPEATVRRFDNWFGGFNFMREFWDRWFEDFEDSSDAWRIGNAWITKQSLPHQTILELGCGTGNLSQQLAKDRPSARVVGADYSASALHLARKQVSVSNVEFRHINLNRIESLGITVDAALSAPFDVVANHVLDQIGHRARNIALRIIRMALLGGGRAYATCHEEHAPDVDASAPTTWHLEQEALRLEASSLGLDTVFVALSYTDEEVDRKPYGVSFTLSRPRTTRVPMNRRELNEESNQVTFR